MHIRDHSILLVMGPGQKFLTRVGSGWVSHLWFGFEFGKFFNFFPFGSKKISLGQVRKYPGQSRVGLLFTAGQK